MIGHLLVGTNKILVCKYLVSIGFFQHHFCIFIDTKSMLLKTPKLAKSDTQKKSRALLKFLVFKMVQEIGSFGLINMSILTKGSKDVFFD